MEPLSNLINQLWKEGNMPTVKKQLADSRTPIQTTVHRGNIFDQSVAVEDLPDTGYRFLIYGQSGSGKTTMACTFPKPLLLIRPEEVEDGSRSVRTVKGVSATPYITTPDHLGEICEGQASTQRYKTLVLDGVTKFQDLVVKKHMGLEDVPVQNTFGMAQQADWNAIGITVKEYLRKLLRLTELGTHVVLVGGERAIGESQDGTPSILIPTVMLALTPASTSWVHDVCDFNVHLFRRQQTVEKIVTISGKEMRQKQATDKVEFCAHVGPDVALYATKFRVPFGTKLPAIMVDADFSKFDKLIKGDS